MAKRVFLWIAGLSVLVALVDVSVTTLSPIWHFVPPPAPLHIPTSPDVQISHITGEDYWYDVATGRRPIFEHDGGIGVAFETDKDGTQSVNYVPACQVFDPSQQAAGYHRAVEELIAKLSKPAETASATQKLEALTGRRFGSAESWRKWLSINQPYLYWSAYSQKLKVDTGAAAVGEPTKISWKTCEMPFYHSF
jgi:hypothetical protein